MKKVQDHRLCHPFSVAGAVLPLVCLLALVTALAFSGESFGAGAPEPKFFARGTRLIHADTGKPVFLKGIGYSPFMPGENPIKGRLPNDNRYADHLQKIKGMNANFIHVFPEFMPPNFFDALRRSGLWFAQDIFVEPLIHDLLDETYQQHALTGIKRVIDHVIASGLSDRLVFFSVGDEMNPGAIYRTDTGHPQVRNFKGKHIELVNRTPSEIALARLVDAAMAYEHETYGIRHLFCHTSFTHLGPVSDRPDLEVAKGSIFFPDFGDIICLNVYTYARGVVSSPPGTVTGTNYQGYIEDLLKIAGKPLVITQVGMSSSPVAPRPDIKGFGGNSYRQIEAVYRRVWEDISTAAGPKVINGVVYFEFSDEWWKPGSPDDELRQDEQDPEEWFGIYSVDNQKRISPKGNLAETIRSLFALP